MSYLRKTTVRIGGGAILALLAVLPAIAGQSVSSLRQGLPGRRISGGTRSECMASTSPLVALNPATNLGKTVSAHPQVYFVVPALESAYPLEFSLRDSDGNRIYENSFDTHNHQGVIGIQLPSQSLELNQDYRWYLSIVCDVQDPAQNDVLSGWLRQVESDVTTDNETHTAGFSDVEAGLALASQYQSSELWTDAISTLAELRTQHPTDNSVRQAWERLLQNLEVETSV